MENEKRYKTTSALLNVHLIASGVMQRVMGNAIQSKDGETLARDINTTIGNVVLNNNKKEA